MSDFLSAIYHVVRKDLIIEIRTKQVTTTATVFSLLVVLTFAFSFVQTFANPRIVGRSALWIAFVFAGTLGVTKTVGIEARNAALDGLLLAPVDRSAIYVGKVLSTAFFVIIVDVVTLAAAVVFLGYAPTPTTLVSLVGVLVVAAFGFAAVAVVVSTLTHRSTLDELVLPVLLVPLVVPVLLAGVEITDALSSGRPTTTWLQLLCSYTGILFLAGIAVFDYVVEE